MADATQAVEPTVAAQAATTETPDTKTTPGAQDGTQDKEPSQTGAAKKVEELPDWAQAEIKSLRKEAADRRKAASDAEETARKTEEATLATTQQWQKLAEKRGGELDALKPKAELADKLSEVVLAQYTAAIKDWPEQVRNMAPGDDASILTKLEWMNKAAPLAKELMGEREPTPGNGRRPHPTAPAGTGAREDKARGEQQKWTRSNF